MRPTVLSLSDASGGAKVTVPVPIDRNLNPVNIGLSVVVTGTATYSVQYTLDDVFSSSYSAASGAWIAQTGQSGATATAITVLTIPVSAVRATQTAGNGSIVFTVIQAG